MDAAQAHAREEQMCDNLTPDVYIEAKHDNNIPFVRIITADGNSMIIKNVITLTLFGPCVVNDLQPF